MRASSALCWFLAARVTSAQLVRPSTAAIPAMTGVGGRLFELMRRTWPYHGEDDLLRARDARSTENTSTASRGGEAGRTTSAATSTMMATSPPTSYSQPRSYKTEVISTSSKTSPASSIESPENTSSSSVDDATSSTSGISRSTYSTPETGAKSSPTQILITPTASAQANETGLSTGAAAGVAIGALVGMVGIVAAVLLIWKRRRDGAHGAIGKADYSPGGAERGAETATAPQVGQHVYNPGREYHATVGNVGTMSSHHHDPEAYSVMHEREGVVAASHPGLEETYGMHVPARYYSTVSSTMSHDGSTPASATSGHETTAAEGFHSLPAFMIPGGRRVSMGSPLSRSPRMVSLTSPGPGEEVMAIETHAHTTPTTPVERKDVGVAESQPSTDGRFELSG